MDRPISWITTRQIEYRPFDQARRAARSQNPAALSQTESLKLINSVTSRKSTWPVRRIENSRVRCGHENRILVEYRRYLKFAGVTHLCAAKGPKLRGK